MTALVGLFLLLGTAVVVPELRAARAGAGEATTRGTVVDLHESTGRSGARLCVPVATFAVDGTTYTSRTGRSSTACPSRGSSVTVIYPTAAPGLARVRPPARVLVTLGLPPVVGVALVALGIGRFVGGLRRLSR